MSMLFNRGSTEPKGYNERQPGVSPVASKLKN